MILDQTVRPTPGTAGIDDSGRKARLRRQGFVGMALAAMLIAAWTAVHVGGVFFYRWTPTGLIAAPFLVLLLCWLNVGLFIVAHDCMHGSLAPGRPRLNRALGRLCLALYAGFSYDRLLPKHLRHHVHTGTEGDPDFDADHPASFAPWLLKFLREYMGWRELLILTLWAVIYQAVLGASLANTLLLWALPAMLSAVQLFYFGTYRPHRQDGLAFGDRHRARSSDYSYLVSLATCFHFGYHHEHHVHPGLPWWRLPGARTRAVTPAGSTAPGAIHRTARFDAPLAARRQG